MNTITREAFEVICPDGVRLKGTLLIPENARAVVQFNCGTGTKKEVYLSFLNFLAEHGYICCLWDYRGSGDSSPVNLRHCDFRYADYGIKDMPAIKAYLNERFPTLPFFIVAHSAGGQQIGFMHNLEGIAGVINFAVSTGYYPNMPAGYRLRAFFYFYVFAPVSVLLSGYVGGKKFGIMEDLPRNVVYEWRDWCAREHYFFDSRFYGKTVPVGHFSSFRFPIHTFWTTDDTISNQVNTETFWKHIQSEQEISFTGVSPEQLGLKRIGHFGFFKRVMKDKIWQQVVERLDRLSGEH